MIDFAKYPSYNHYRSVVDRTTLDPPLKAQKGADVYALQKAINATTSGPVNLTTDGRCGPKTGAAIWKVQKLLGIVEDGKAGQQTQTALTLFLLSNLASGDLYKLEFGHIQRESSFWLGNYSEKRTDDTPLGWSYDAGVTQQNSAHNDVADAFDPVKAILKIVTYTQAAFDRYVDNSRFVGDDHSERRRWALAAGHWNAPAYAQWLAGFRDNTSKEPGPTARGLFEEYMEEAVCYL